MAVNFAKLPELLRRKARAVVAPGPSRAVIRQGVSLARLYRIQDDDRGYSLSGASAAAREIVCPLRSLTRCNSRRHCGNGTLSASGNRSTIPTECSDRRAE